MDESFIGEPLKPIADAYDAAAMAVGEPGLPRGFIWRGEQYVIEVVLEQWKESGRDRAPTSEVYLRKHWYRLRMTNGCEMKIYFERQARSKRQAKSRWWLYTLSTDEND